VFRIVELAKEVFPGVPLLLGGIYAQLCPEHASLSGADSIQDVPLDIACFQPALDLYTEPGYALLMTSFGCPLACEYCASRMLNPRFVERTEDEMRADASFQLSLPGVRDAAFYDDALLVGKEKRFYPLCTFLSNTFPGVQYHTPNGLHIREIDAKCANILKKTGFATLRLSLESSDPEFQRKGSAKTSGEEFREALSNLRNAGFLPEQMETYILAGLPGQSARSIAESIRFVKDCGARAKPAEFSPVPGTRSFEEAALFLPDLRSEPLLHNKTVYSSYISGTLPPDELQNLKNLARR
jgi:radical SAM superfamily enzyme YgiQ (UPF0313 family)